MTSAATEQTVITQPGLYQMDAETYHADPVPGRSLSSTGARRIVQTCPAVFREYQLRPAPSRDVLDFGKAAHALVLGDGAELVVVHASTWRTKAAQQARTEARAAGKVPVLGLSDDPDEPSQWDTIQAMAAKIREHPVASKIFNPEHGKPEQALFWRDEHTGLWCRALLDWLPDQQGRRLIITDYKTARSANPPEFGRSVADYGYAQQADWYLTGAQQVLDADNAAFLFVVQEKTRPYVVTVTELDASAMAVGRFLNRRAINTYCECVTTGVWPGYSDSIALTSMPGWYLRQFEDDIPNL